MDFLLQTRDLTAEVENLFRELSATRTGRVPGLGSEVYTRLCLRSTPQRAGQSLRNHHQLGRGLDISRSERSCISHLIAATWGNPSLKRPLALAYNRACVASSRTPLELLARSLPTLQTPQVSHQHCLTLIDGS